MIRCRDGNNCYFVAVNSLTNSNSIQIQLQLHCYHLQFVSIREQDTDNVIEFLIELN